MNLRMQHQGFADANPKGRSRRKKKLRRVVFVIIVCLFASAVLLYLNQGKESNATATDVVEYSTVPLPRRDIQANLVLAGVVAPLAGKAEPEEFVYVAELENAQSDHLVMRSALSDFDISLKMNGADQSRNCARGLVLNLDPSDGATDLTQPALVKCYLDDKFKASAARSAKLSLNAEGLSKPLVLAGVLEREQKRVDSVQGVVLELDAPQLQRVTMLAGGNSVFNTSVQVSGVREPVPCRGEFKTSEVVTDGVVATFSCELPESSAFVTNLEVRATIELQTSMNALVAPKSTVRLINSDLGVVTVLDGRGGLQEIEVALGLEDSLGIEILGGLQENELLVDLGSL